MEERIRKVAAALSSAAERNLGGPVRIENLGPLSGGASADTWSFDAECGGKRYELILRLAPPRKDQIRLDRMTEAKLLSLAGEAGVPAPKVLFQVDEEDGLNSGYAMERISGETIARKILRDERYAEARSRMARQCGEILFRIHSMDTSSLPPLKEQPAATLVEQLYPMYRSFGQELPVFELTFRWLKDHLPESAPLRFVHGDFRNGNFIVGPEGIRAVLDWELAHLGDPMEDLGWICVNSWRFGNIDLPVGGFGLREDLFAGYQAAGGGLVDPGEVHFWEIFGTLKWGLITILQAFTHLGGSRRSVELAAIGRRTSETEMDLVRLLRGLAKE
jgi:aminoglycoside phosphotransferase (APT) family kinase protein